MPTRVQVQVEEESFSDEEMKAKSEALHEARASEASLSLAFYAVRIGIAGGSSRDVAQRLITNMFHLADLTGFNLESVIDQARTDFYGQRRVDEIEKEVLETAIRGDREILTSLLSGGAEMFLELQEEYTRPAKVKVKKAKKRGKRA